MYRLVLTEMPPYLIYYCDLLHLCIACYSSEGCKLEYFIG